MVRSLEYCTLYCISLYRTGKMLELLTKLEKAAGFDENVGPFGIYRTSSRRRNISLISSTSANRSLTIDLNLCDQISSAEAGNICCIVLEQGNGDQQNFGRLAQWVSLES